jgi:5-methylcytosine-specific restriction endonuclease McrA
MARPRLRARFFVFSNGDVVVRARPLTPNQRRAIHARDRHTCQLCGVRVRWFRVPFYDRSGVQTGAVDHIVPRARGGQNDAGNLRLACERCNSSRGAAL